MQISGKDTAIPRNAGNSIQLLKIIKKKYKPYWVFGILTSFIKPIFYLLPSWNGESFVTDGYRRCDVGSKAYTLTMFIIWCNRYKYQRRVIVFMELLPNSGHIRVDEDRPTLIKYPTNSWYKHWVADYFLFNTTSMGSFGYLPAYLLIAWIEKDEVFFLQDWWFFPDYLFLFHKFRPCLAHELMSVAWEGRV